jgi:hypothetical protein
MAVIATAAFIITWRFWPVWSFILFFIDFFIFLIYLVVIIQSIMFWLGKRKIFKNAFFPFLINSIPMIVILLSPPMGRNKSYYKRTTDLQQFKGEYSTGCHLYVESYLISCGFMATDVDALYLTDSLNFRLYEGTYDEGDGSIVTSCKGDSILIEKYVHEKLGVNFGALKVVERKSYNLNDLKRNHIFE